MNAYLNISDFSNALNICKAYKRGKYGYDFQDYVLARQYASEFMKEIWNIVKKCEVSLKEAFSLIRWNTAAITTKTLEILKSWLKPIKSLSPKAISQSLSALAGYTRISYNGYAANAEKRGDAYYERSQEGKDFLSLAEPIKIGHHSEKRHRALIERTQNAFRKFVEENKKAEAYE